MSGKFDTYYGPARQMYLAGKTFEKIKAQLGVSLPTLSKWKDYGDWEKERAKLRQQKISTIERLQRALDKKSKQLEELDPNDDAGKLVDQISKLSAAIDRIRTKRDPLGATLLVMDEFTGWLQKKNMDAYVAVSPYLPAFFEHMRSKADGQT